MTETRSGPRSATVTSRRATASPPALTIQTESRPFSERSAVAGRGKRAATGRDSETVMVAPSRKAGGGFSSVMRTRRVRVVWSAKGETSRTRPAAVTSGALWSETAKRPSFGMAPARSSGMSTTASRSSGRATVTTAWPALSTCPTSALRCVTTPSKSAFSSV
ncbi:hypothetical protein LDDCCGHA_6012 [Methylobacterium oxalidis]|nr:hypothetical protein LDDCCGHA_6012 [Methylobacterium oxalidis]